jgi:hypothetical protein
MKQFLLSLARVLDGIGVIEKLLIVACLSVAPTVLGFRDFAVTWNILTLPITFLSGVSVYSSAEDFVERFVST